MTNKQKPTPLPQQAPPPPNLGYLKIYITFSPYYTALLSKWLKVKYATCLTDTNGSIYTSNVKYMLTWFAGLALACTDWYKELCPHHTFRSQSFHKFSITANGNKLNEMEPHNVLLLKAFYANNWKKTMLSQHNFFFFLRNLVKVGV